MRCLAIAEEWSARGGSVLWLTRETRTVESMTTAINVRILELQAEPGTSADAVATREVAQSCRASWVLADLFGYDPSYFASAKTEDGRWMITCDEPLEIGDQIDAVLSPGPQATSAHFPGRKTSCDLLLGLEYALLRAAIRRDHAGTASRQIPPRNILMTFGGSDPNDLTHLTISLLRSHIPVSGIQWRVVLGPNYRGQCAAGIDDCGGWRVEFLHDVSDMARQYEWADLIICGASTTLWEALFFALPVIAIPAAASQLPLFNALVRFPAITRFSTPDQSFGEWISSLCQGRSDAVDWLTAASAAGPAMVDGRGTVRAVDYMLSRN